MPRSIHGFIPRPRSLAAPLALAALCLTACEQRPVKVGVVLPLSGEHQAYGEASRRGIDLALGELKAAGNERFVVSFEDDASDPEQARQLLSRLYDSGEALVAIGGLTALETAAMAGVAEEAERVLLSPSARHENLSEGARHVYRIATNDVVAGNAMADFVRREYDVDTAATLAGDEVIAAGIAQGFAATFEAQGGELVASLTGPDFDTAAAEIARLAPDAVYLDAYQPAAGEAIRALRAAGYRGKLLTTQAVAGSKAVLASLGKAAVDLRYTVTPLDLDQPRVQEFVESYRAAYGEDPDLFAAEAYDTVHVLATAMEGRAAIPSEVRKGLRDEVKNYEGITGTLQFNEAGSVNKYPKIFRIAKNLEPVNEREWLAAEKERIEEEKRRLREKLKRLQTSSTQLTSTTASGS